MYLADMSRLSPTARVILGLLRLAPHTGYEIKQTTDRSTRFFWGASYGQIYPELRRLEAAGLAVASEEPRGAVRRRVYRITPPGEQAVEEWLTESDEDFDIRDEGLLKLFFGAALTQEDLVTLVRRRRSFFEDVSKHFRAIGEELGPIDNPSGEVLRYGVELMDWNTRWWAALESRLNASLDAGS
jgi:DNA-binding PadR family transcriptional regulator